MQASYLHRASRSSISFHLSRSCRSRAAAAACAGFAVLTASALPALARTQDKAAGAKNPACCAHKTQRPPLQVVSVGADGNCFFCALAQSDAHNKCAPHITSFVREHMFCKTIDSTGAMCCGNAFCNTSRHASLAQGGMQTVRY